MCQKETYMSKEVKAITKNAPIALTEDKLNNIYHAGYASALDAIYDIVEKCGRIDKSDLDIVCNHIYSDNFTLNHYLRLVRDRKWSKMVE